MKTSKNKVNSEQAATYAAKKSINLDKENKLIKRAFKILDSRIRTGDALTSPQLTKDYLRLALSSEPAEVFACLFMDNKNRVISFDKLFFGTIDGASVYPREVIRAAINHNAAAVIFSHNHPSGITEPSHADEQITNRLKDALSLIDVRVLDHIIVGNDCTSFAERGLI